MFPVEDVCCTVVASLVGDMEVSCAVLPFVVVGFVSVVDVFCVVVVVAREVLSVSVVFVEVVVPVVVPVNTDSVVLVELEVVVCTVDGVSTEGVVVALVVVDVELVAVVVVSSS